MYKDYSVVHESRIIDVFLVQILIAVLIISTIVLLYSLSKVFKKASIKERYAYIPFYNIYKLLELCGVEKIHLLLLFIPPIGFYSWYKICTSLAECFNKDKNFAYVIYFLPVIAIPILGLTREKFVGINNKRVNGIFIEELKKEEVEEVTHSEVLRRNTQIGMGVSKAPNLTSGEQPVISEPTELKMDSSILTQKKEVINYVECPNCHNKVRDTADVCFYCGTKLKG